MKRNAKKEIDAPTPGRPDPPSCKLKDLDKPARSTQAQFEQTQILQAYKYLDTVNASWSAQVVPSDSRFHLNEIFNSII